MIDTDILSEVVFNVETNLMNEMLSGVSMFLMMNNENVDEAGDVNEADFVWWSRTCSCNLMLFANLTEQRRHAKTSRRTAFSVCMRAFFVVLSFALRTSCSAYMRI